MYISSKLSLSDISDMVSSIWIDRACIPFHILRYDSRVFELLRNFAVQYNLDAVLYQEITDLKIVGNLVFKFNRYPSSTIIREFRKILADYLFFI